MSGGIDDASEILAKCGIFIVPQASRIRPWDELIALPKEKRIASQPGCCWN
jgi:hypothetical protein